MTRLEQRAWGWLDELGGLRKYGAKNGDSRIKVTERLIGSPLCDWLLERGFIEARRVKVDWRGRKAVLLYPTDAGRAWCRRYRRRARWALPDERQVSFV